MKKALYLILILYMLIGLCACTNQNQTALERQEYIVVCNDGTTRHMTAAEIIDMYNNNRRNYDKLLDDAVITGSGTISAIYSLEAVNWSYPDHRPTLFEGGIGLADPQAQVITYVKSSLNDIEGLYIGDKVNFRGTLSVFGDKIRINLWYSDDEAYLEYAG